MYVQVDYALRSALSGGLTAKCSQIFNKATADFIAKYPELGNHVLKDILPEKYDQYWLMASEIFNHRAMDQIMQKHPTMHLNFGDGLMILYPLNPPLKVPLYHHIGAYNAKPLASDWFTKFETTFPGLSDSVEYLKALMADHKILQEAANKALESSSLKVVLERAPFLEEWVEAGYMHDLRKPAERKPKPKKVAYEPSAEEAEAILLAQTRLKVS